MKKLIRQAKLYTLVLTALLLTASIPALAQHEKHDMSNMPGMSKPKPKAKPKPTMAKRRRPAQARPKPADANEVNDTESSEPTSEPTTEAVPTESPAPQPSPPNVHKHEPAAPATTAPAAAPEKMETPMASPSPEANQPQPSAPHKHDMGNMTTGGVENQPQPANDDAMEGMKGMVHPSSGAGEMPGEADPNALMVMSDGMMDIRVGLKQYNFLAMGQMGSGTSWQPSTTPMYMWSKARDKWLLFIHGDAKLGINSQGGARGITKFESQNWIMPMAFRRVGAGTLQLRGMFSLEPFTFSPDGSPQLFQTGETYQGRFLVDKQHPHDLFMELSATYTIPLGERATWFTYLGFPGEPSLGPTAFMHRASASENPTAPLSHHLQDSSHISFGVFSTGFTYRWFKLEGSLFNGREPDENRYNFEFNPWNSRSVRFSIAPTRNLTMQWSYGLLKNPEALKPGDVRRMTASVSYNKRLASGNWATTLIWGRNDENHADDVETLNGYVAESTLNFLEKNYVYTRLETVDKVDLFSHDEAERLGIDDHAIFRVGAYTFGAARDIWNTEKFSLALGGDLTFYSKPEALDSVYGNNPVSYKFFIRLRPGKMSMSGHAGH